MKTCTFHKICCFYCGQTLGDVITKNLGQNIRLLAFCEACDPFLHSGEVECNASASFGVLPKYTTFDERKWQEFINSNFL